MKIKYANGEIMPEEIVRFISLAGQADTIFYNAIKFHEAQKEASRLGLSYTDDELQQFADNFRKLHGLITAEDTYSFFKRYGLTEDDFELFCERSLLMAHLKDRLGDRKTVEDFFVNNRGDFDLARISVIVVKDQNLADEIVMQITDEGEDFHLLARKHSIDAPTKYAGGYVGPVRRKMLSQAVAAKVFNATPGDILGPFSREGVFQLILVEDIKKAEFNDDVYEGIKERLFEEWFLQTIKGGFEISE